MQWWFVFKFNTASFPGCAEGAERQCLFGGDVQRYKAGFGQQYVVASSTAPALRQGAGCAGDTLADPIGATFDQVYNGSAYYVVWNDQFYDDPYIEGCTKSCSAPWGHSKGLLAWNDSGAGFVLQVTTPSWPGSGNRRFPRKHDGNTLGCVDDDDVEVSQHFFALALTKDDVVKVLEALQHASVVTDPDLPQLVHNGGPADVQKLVRQLGRRSQGTAHTRVTLSSGVELISKPSLLHVPPWQLVSAVLGGLPLRAATWWATPEIASSAASTPVACWSDGLPRPGPVEIATSGQWDGRKFGLAGGLGKDFNHAKVGVSLDPRQPLVVFGDMNQQGTLSPEPGRKRTCASSQNGRGGTFFVIKDRVLHDSVTELIRGESAPLAR